MHKIVKWASGWNHSAFPGRIFPSKNSLVSFLKKAQWNPSEENPFEDEFSTEAESDREWARQIGRQNPQKAWILSDRDVWYPNPYYRGPHVPHPESDNYDLEVPPTELIPPAPKKPSRQEPEEEMPF